MTKYLMQKLDSETLEMLADMICGDDTEKFPTYRKSSYLTKFFQDIGISVAHNGDTRKWWTLEVLESLSLEKIERVILRLVDPKLYRGDKESLKKAVSALEPILNLEGYTINFEGKTPQLRPYTTTDDPLEGMSESEEKRFLEREFSFDSLQPLGIQPEMEDIINSRLEEIEITQQYSAPLAAIFLAGSTLEGVLLHVAIADSKNFTQANSAPIDKNTKKAKKPQNWSLSDLIEVSYELNYLEKDIKKFSHVLRDFRNYIHPHQQSVEQFNPTYDTSRICIQVLKGAFAQLVATKKKEKKV